MLDAGLLEHVVGVLDIPQVREHLQNDYAFVVNAYTKEVGKPVPVDQGNAVLSGINKHHPDDLLVLVKMYYQPDIYIADLEQLETMRTGRLDAGLILGHIFDGSLVGRGLVKSVHKGYAAMEFEKSI